MNYQTCLHKSKNFVLTETQNKKTGKPVYRIIYKSVHLHDQLKEIRDVLDPDRTLFCKKASFTFRYTDLEQAEKNYMILVLKWG